MARIHRFHGDRTCGVKTLCASKSLPLCFCVRENLISSADRRAFESVRAKSGSQAARGSMPFRQADDGMRFGVSIADADSS